MSAFTITTGLWGLPPRLLISVGSSQSDGGESGPVSVQASLSPVPIPMFKFPQRDLWFQEHVHTFYHAILALVEAFYLDMELLA